MRIWDIHPGYLDRADLLGEHSAVHALAAALLQVEPGLAQHPETLRWKGRLGALRCRHDLVAAELLLRGSGHTSPLTVAEDRSAWPDTYLDAPAAQFELLARRYAERAGEEGRIPWPRNSQQLWAQHKYSVLARSRSEYEQIGRSLAGTGKGVQQELAERLTRLLRVPPRPEGVRDALLHMWGYVSEKAGPRARQWALSAVRDDPTELLRCIARLAEEQQVVYLLHSTALSDLAVA